MKTLSCVLLLMAAMAFVLLGCSDNSTPTLSPVNANHTTVASLMKTNGPGAWIIRGEYDTYRVGFIDPTSGLALILGVNDFSTFCPTRLEGIDKFPFKDIFLPNADPNLRRVLEQIKAGDISAYVWDLDLFQGSFCATWLLYPPLAVGTVNYVYTDNDLLAFMQDNPNNNAFGYKANGALTGPNGQVYNLNLVYRIVWDPDGTKFHETFHLQLAPTGNN